MITVELKKRLITSLFLISLLILMFFYSYILISALIVVAIIAWVEFNLLIDDWKKEDIRSIVKSKYKLSLIKKLKNEYNKEKKIYY